MPGARSAVRIQSGFDLAQCDVARRRIILRAPEHIEPRQVECRVAVGDDEFCRGQQRVEDRERSRAAGAGVARPAPARTGEQVLRLARHPGIENRTVEHIQRVAVGVVEHTDAARRSRRPAQLRLHTHEHAGARGRREREVATAVGRGRRKRVATRLDQFNDRLAYRLFRSAGIAQPEIHIGRKRYALVRRPATDRDGADPAAAATTSTTATTATTGDQQGRRQCQHGAAPERARAARPGNSRNIISA